MVVFPAMSQLSIDFPTTKTSMDELRDALDAAIHQEFPGGMMKREWDGDVLRLKGPGAEGTVTFEDGRLVGRASLGGPALLMKPVIASKMTAVLKRIAG